jgi:oxygen-independent coproporphyrinogen-3 oxidase
LAFSVYIHLPYCLKKCPYCDFNTYAVNEVPERRYSDAVVREIEAAAESPTWAGRPIATVFFGGGTPSLFAPATIGAMLERLASRFGFESDAEITLEANPGSLEGAAADKLAGFRAAGVNRLSVGGQSFNARHLATLGRVHGPAEITNALEQARRAGFANVSCDLIFAVPGQTLDDWADDLRRVIELAPDHVSAYNLTYESGTPLTGLRNAGRIEAAGEELESDMYELAIERLGRAGLRHYEISNFARPNREARHNLAYWTWRDYLGIGAGAHGFARERDGGANGGAGDGRDIAGGVWGRRYANVRLPEKYMNAEDHGFADGREVIDRETAIEEYVMLGLRLIDGLSLDEFRATFGAGIDEERPALAGLRDGKLLEDDGERLKLTPRGLMLADSVIARVAAAAR